MRICADHPRGMRISRVLVVSAVMTALFPHAAQAADLPPASDPVRVVVQFDGAVVPTSKLDAAVEGAEVSVAGAVSARTRVYELDGAQGQAEVAQAIAELESLPGVREVVVDAKVFPTSNDEFYDDQWYLHDTHGINAPSAWQYTSGEGVRVAVVDTGHTTHPDLDANVINGYDFISDVETANDGGGRDADASDPGDYTTLDNCVATSSSSWHGTHVTGVVAAVAGNGTGVAGTAPKSKVLSVRALGTCGGSMADVIAGVRWAAGLSVPGVPANQYPARVVNLSLSSAESCQAWVQTALNEVAAAGVLVVAAAGNANTNASGTSPASCTNVLTVAATNSIGSKASFSNYGPVVDIAAPGTSVLNTVNDGLTTPTSPAYSWMSGTSMATPQVAAVAALVLSLQPSMSLADLRSRLLTTARAFPAGSTCTSCGAGIVDAGAAVAVGAAVVLPSAPRNVSAQQIGSIVRVSWVAPTSAGTSAVSGYEVTGGTGCSAAGLSCDISGLPAGSQTVFSVRARNTTGLGASGSSSSVTFIGVPGAPNEPIVTIDGLTAIVLWQAPGDDGGSAVTGYTVSGSPNGSCSTAATTCSIGGLSPGTTYSFSIVATNLFGTGSAVVSGGHTTAVGPAAPVASTVSFGETSVMVSWEAGSGGLSVEKFVATATPGGATCETTGSRCAISGLTPGSTYSVTLVAVGPAGTQNAAPAMSGTTSGSLPSTPPVVEPPVTPPVTPPATSLPAVPPTTNVPTPTAPPAATGITVVRGSRTSLTKLLKLGNVKPTWRVSGGCKVSKGSLVAPKKAAKCKVTATYKVRGRTKTVTRTITVV